MINIILSNVLSGNPRQVQYWRKLVFDMDTRIEYYRTSRFLLAPVVQSPLVNLLKYLLLNIDTKYLLTLSSDFDRYTKYVSLEVDNLRGAFDPVKTGTLSKNTFLMHQPGKPAPEVIVSSSYANPLMELPMERDWLNWRKVTPVHILNHDSSELVSDLYRFALKFKHDHPTYLVASIDIVALIFKYLHYLIELESDANVEHFIHHFIINDLYTDLKRIWLMNHMTDQLTVLDSSDTFKKYQPKASPLLVSSAFTPAMQDFTREFLLTKNLNVRFGDFLATHWFSGYSITDYLKTLVREVQFPPHKQYTFAKVLRELPILKFVVITNNQRPPSHPEARQLNLLLRRVVETYQRNKVWRVVRSPSITPMLEQEINSLYEMMIR